MSPAPLALHYYVEKPNLMGMQNIIGKKNRNFAKGAG